LSSVVTTTAQQNCVGCTLLHTPTAHRCCALA
jgi:hypothetical protein